jgi:hypothetical protein
LALPTLNPVEVIGGFLASNTAAATSAAGLSLTPEEFAELDAAGHPKTK